MTRDDIRRTLVAYDVADDRRRMRLASLLQRHGDRVQYSVFVLDIVPSRLVRLQEQVADLIKVAEDSVLYCDLGLLRNLREDQFRHQGRLRPLTPHRSLIL